MNHNWIPVHVADVRGRFAPLEGGATAFDRWAGFQRDGALRKSFAVPLHGGGVVSGRATCDTGAVRTCPPCGPSTRISGCNEGSRGGSLVDLGEPSVEQAVEVRRFFQRRKMCDIGPFDQPSVADREATSLPLEIMASMSNAPNRTRVGASMSPSRAQAGGSSSSSSTSFQSDVSSKARRCMRSTADRISGAVEPASR